MYGSRIYFLLLLLIFSSCKSQRSAFKSAAKYYVVMNATPEKSGATLLHELKNRTSLKFLVEGVALQKEVNDGVRVWIRLDKNLAGDYCIKYDGKTLFLTAKTELILQFLSFEFIKVVTENDSRFSGEGLEPSTILMTTECKTFDFSYREPFYPTNLRSGYSRRNANQSVDLDWGLWGHNLYQVIKDQNNPAYYAQVNGKTTKDQLRFTSDVLFSDTEEFILDNFGEGDKQMVRFVIAPMDNTIVSLDKESVSLGNTSSDGTPALAYFVRKLALRFPNHRFYTIAYLSTKQPPKEVFPPNVGVLISSVDLPKGVITKDNSKVVNEFIQLIKSWESKVSEIILWDYINNYDDYFSPLSNLYSIKANLDTYKALGIDGVFLNGSGYEYSVFEDVRTFVLTALLKDKDADIDGLVSSYLNKFFPETSEILRRFLLEGEQRFISGKVLWPMYGSMRNNLDTHLDYQQVQALYKSLAMVVSTVENTERERIHQILAALSYTLLQGNYELYVESLSSGHPVHFRRENTREWLSALKSARVYSNMRLYKEFPGELEQYIRYWETNLMDNSVNFLSGKKIAITEVGKSEMSPYMLTDGLEGFGYDYHHGWWIGSPTVISFVLPASKITKTLSISFLDIKKHRFKVPEHLELIVEGSIAHDPVITNKSHNIYQISWNIPPGDTATVYLKFKDEPIGQSYAIGEITLN